MKHLQSKALTWALCLSMALTGLTSCSDDDKEFVNLQQGVVTVKTAADNRQYLQIDDETTLYPSNLTGTLFDGKEVRAMVIFHELEEKTTGFSKTIYINAIDSIRTKGMVSLQEGETASQYGSDPVEIVKDWMTVSEDGYLTLRLRTRWSNAGAIHEINLVTGSNPEDPFELVLCHDAKGDVQGLLGDALIAFRLDKLPVDQEGKKSITLKWQSFEDGMKSATFPFTTRK